MVAVAKRLLQRDLKPESEGTWKIKVKEHVTWK